jgi:hypothetical protein
MFINNSMSFEFESGNYSYSARRLMGSRLIESAAYCNQIWLAQQCMNIAQKHRSVN